MTDRKSQIDERLGKLNVVVIAFWRKTGLNNAELQQWGPLLLRYELSDIERALDELKGVRRMHQKGIPDWGVLEDAFEKAKAYREREEPKQHAQLRDWQERERLDDLYDELSVEMRMHLEQEALKDDDVRKLAEIFHSQAPVRTKARMLLAAKLQSGEWTEELIRIAAEEEKT
jgi:hypothetical protein